MRRIHLMLFIFCVASFSSYAQSRRFVKDSIDRYIEQGLKDWDLPGLALVVIQDGKVIKSKGYGYRDQDRKTPVDENTLFMIASNTKLFTGLALAQLEMRQKLNLNDKVTAYFPGFQLFDPISTQLVTIRDLLSHRIGTKTFQGDFTFWNSKLSREQIREKMRLLRPSQLFRQDYGYCNSCFMVAGEIIPKVTGKSWEKYVEDSIFLPLEMKNSTALSRGMEGRENVAIPYTTSFTGQLRRVPYDQWDNLGPAASIISNVKDLSHWLQFQLDSGRYKQKTIMPFSILQRTRDVNISLNSRKSALLPVHFRGYGLGLNAADYNGRQIYWHTGGAGGMLSNVCFVPEERLGIAILTNNDNQSFFEALRYDILDAYLGMPFMNRSHQFLKTFREEMKDQLAQIGKWRERLGTSNPERPLTAYAGDYYNELYGRLTMASKGKDLVLRFETHEDLTATMKYIGKDEWLLEYDNIEYGIFAVRFKVENEKVISVEIKANEFVEFDPYTFIKL
jgi:CubicO group peptidase (beta-lactamase class C family)